MRGDSTGRIMAMAQDVSLSLTEHDRERLARLSGIPKDTGSAVVWWLSRKEKEVEGSVDRIALLARLSTAANNESVAPPRGVLADGTTGSQESTDWQRPYGVGDGAASGNGAGDGL